MAATATPSHRFLRHATFLTLILVLLAALNARLHGQTLTTIYQLTGGADGLFPTGVIMDRAGNLYGTAVRDGIGTGPCEQFGGCGTVFRLSYHGSWTFSLLYSFTGGGDGVYPTPPTFGPDGSLYGSTSFGGAGPCGYDWGCGIIYRLQPPATFCRSTSCPWTETILHRFRATDGSNPNPPVFDGAGNIYGTSGRGGILQGCGGLGCGNIFQLVHSGGNWTENVLYEFSGGNDGALPPGGVVLDRAGNLYGLTSYSEPYQCGTAFELTNSGQSWTLTTLYAFDPQIGDGCQPSAAPIFDTSGNLYGASLGNSLGAGAVFQLVPGQGSWTENVLHLFPADAQSADSPLILDSQGNLYGTTYTAGEYGCGSVYKLTPSNGGWIYTSLHDFNGLGDGCNPVGPISMDSQGNIYGSNYSGSIWKLTP